MKRETFNEDILFKKKPIPEKKEVVKPKNNIFAEGSDEEGGFNFKKSQKKQEIKVKVNTNTVTQDSAKQNKKGLLDSESDQDSSNIFKKKPVAKPTTAKA